jgi:hypothetical protein
MSDLVYALLKSGRDYDRTIVEQAMEKRREQLAHAEIGRVPKALPAPDRRNLGRSRHSSK